MRRTPSGVIRCSMNCTAPAATRRGCLLLPSTCTRPFSRGARPRSSWFCRTADTKDIKTVPEYHTALTAAEVPHNYFEVEGVEHSKIKLYESRRNTWFDVHVEALKRNGVELHYVKGVP